MKVRKDTKTHQVRDLAIDDITVTVLTERLRDVIEELGVVDVELLLSAYIFSSDPVGLAPWDPSWVTKKVSEVAAAADIAMTVKRLRHYSASQLLAGGSTCGIQPARLGYGGGGATTLRHHADPVSEVDRRATAYLASLTNLSPAGDGRNVSKS